MQEIRIGPGKMVVQKVKARRNVSKIFQQAKANRAGGDIPGQGVGDDLHLAMTIPLNAGFLGGGEHSMGQLGRSGFCGQAVDQLLNTA